MVHPTFELCIILPADPSHLHPNKLFPCFTTSQWEPLLGINKAQRKLFKNWKGKVKQNYAIWSLWRRLWVWWDKELLFCSVGGGEDLALWECEHATFVFSFSFTPTKAQRSCCGKISTASCQNIEHWRPRKTVLRSLSKIWSLRCLQKKEGAEKLWLAKVYELEAERTVSTQPARSYCTASFLLGWTYSKEWLCWTWP